MLVTLANIEKITLSSLWFSKVTDTQSWLFLAFATNFQKFSNLATVLFLDIFHSYVEELLLIKLSLTLENFIAKLSKGLWDILGRTWHEIKKLEKWGTFVASVTHDRSENLHWKNFTYSLWYGKFTIQNSWMVLNVFIKKKFDKVCAYKFCVIQRSWYSLLFIIPLLFKLALLLHKFIIKFWNSVVSCAKSITCLSRMQLKKFVSFHLKLWRPVYEYIVPGFRKPFAWQVLMHPLHYHDSATEVINSVFI